METTIDEAGRIAIPMEVQAQFGLTPGMKLDVEAANGTMTIKPACAESGLVRKDGAWVICGELDGDPAELNDLVKRDREERMRRVAGL